MPDHSVSCYAFRRIFRAQRVSIMVRRKISQGVVLDAGLPGKVQGERKTDIAQIRMLFSAFYECPDKIKEIKYVNKGEK